MVPVRTTGREAKEESTQGQAGARTEPTRYRSYEMPSDYGVEDFVESWAGREA